MSALTMFLSGLPASAGPIDRMPTSGGSVLEAGRPGSSPASLRVADSTPRIDLESINPAILRRNTSVVITGRVTAGTRVLTEARVEAVLAADPMLSREAIRSWSNDDTKAVSGRSVATTLTSAGAKAIPPLSSATFALTLDATTIGLPGQPYGVLPIAISLTTATTGAARTTLRTTITFHTRKEYEPLTVGWLAPITAPGDAALLAADPVEHAEAWRNALGPDSAIDRLIAGTADTPMTYVLDPSLVNPLPPLPADDDVPSGDVDALADRLLDRLTPSPDHPLWTLPPVDADVAAIAENGPMSSAATALLARGATVPGAVRSDVVWPTDGALDAAREKAVTTLYGGPIPLAIVSASVLPGVAGYTTSAPGRTSATTLIGFDDRLSGLMGRFTSTPRGVLTTQRILAETLSILAEQPGTARDLLVALPRGIDPDPRALRTNFEALTQAPWLQLRPADALIDDQVTAVKTGESAWAQTARGRLPSPLTPSRLRQLDEDRTQLDAVVSVLSLDAEFSEHWLGVSDDLLSTRWRGQSTAWRAAHEDLTSALESATDGIRVLPQRLNFLADSGSLQITIVNELDTAVQGLLLVLEPANARMRILSDPPVVSVGAQSRVTVRVAAQAVASGLVPIRARLTTTDGVPIGAETELLVRANPPSPWLYWVAGGGAAGIFVLGLWRSLRKGKRRAVAPPAGSSQTVG